MMSKTMILMCFRLKSWCAVELEQMSEHVGTPTCRLPLEVKLHFHQFVMCHVIIKLL